jgi:hypothetical protein
MKSLNLEISDDFYNEIQQIKCTSGGKQKMDDLDTILRIALTNWYKKYKVIK